MTKSENKTILRVNPRKILWALLAVTGGLVLIHLLLQFLSLVVEAPVPDTLVGRLDVDNEISIPTWWIQILLFASSALGAVIYKLRASKQGRTGWLVFSALFLFLSIDEGAMLHESVVTKLREWTTDGAATGLADHLWLVPATIIVAGGFALFIRFAKSLPRRTFILLGSGIAVLVFGGVFYEAIGLMVFSETGGFWYHGLNVVIEEGLEMTGASLVVYALLDHLSSGSSKITIDVRS